jgi:uncharacterized membrane protein
MLKRGALWFALVVLLFVASLFMHEGIAQSLVRTVAGVLFIITCIVLVGRGVRDNPVSADMVTKRSIEAGVTGWMADDEARRRRKQG